MNTSHNPSDSSEVNTYVMDPEGAAEMARLLRQESWITNGMGGVFQDEIDLNDVHRVLDLACGPGSWALEVAYKYSDIEVVGVDVSERMIQYAQAHARVQGRSNLHFEVMNILEQLDFPDRSFDFINARLVCGFMKREMWPVFIQNALRVLRPGGILRLTEMEPGMSNKPHFARMNHLVMRMMETVGMSFSPEQTTLGVIQMLPMFLRQAGLHIEGRRAYYIEFSTGTPTHQSFYFDYQNAVGQLSMMMERLGLCSQADWRTLAQQALAEMFEEDFCCAWTFLSVWGKKPEE